MVCSVQAAGKSGGKRLSAAFFTSRCAGRRTSPKACLQISIRKLSSVSPVWTPSTRRTRRRWAAQAFYKSRFGPEMRDRGLIDRVLVRQSPLSIGRPGSLSPTGIPKGCWDGREEETLAWRLCIGQVQGFAVRSEACEPVCGVAWVRIRLILAWPRCVRRGARAGMIRCSSVLKTNGLLVSCASRQACFVTGIGLEQRCREMRFFVSLAVDILAPCLFLLRLRPRLRG